ncbi:MAG: hypothetical protein IJM41_00740 [Bacteroidales bacterium]|nr:hypothetical protein [Bacteroidales bacterium]
MKIENIEKCKALLESRDKLLTASSMLEEQSAQVVLMTIDGALDLSGIPEPELTYAVMDALAARVNDIDKQLLTL